MKPQKQTAEMELTLRQISWGLDKLVENFGQAYHVGVGRINPDGPIHIYLTNFEGEEDQQFFAGKHECFVHHFTLSTQPTPK